MTTNSTSQRSNTFGIIALVISILLFFTPKILITLVLVAWVIFLILGFVRDRSKVFSAISLVLGGLVFVVMVNGAMQEQQMYTIEYAVACSSCEARYTNETGGDSKEQVSGYWTRSLQMRGDEFLHLTAQGDRNNFTVKATIKVDGRELDTQTSTGEYSIASAHGQAVDINSK